MLKIDVQEDCGNAPKKAFIRDFNIAFVKGEIEALLDNLADDIEWHMIGDKTMSSKEEVKEFLAPMMSSKATELVIKHIVTHGNTAACDGTMSFEDGSKIAFCDFYTFTGHDKNAKIREITSYGVELEE